MFTFITFSALCQPKWYGRDFRDSYENHVSVRDQGEGIGDIDQVEEITVQRRSIVKIFEWIVKQIMKGIGNGLGLKG